MKRLPTIRKDRSGNGFTMPEILVAVSILAILFAVTMASLSFDRVSGYKEKELGILADFGYHYIELMKGLPFEDITPGRPINALYDGSGGSPNISIPLAATWVNLETSEYQAFHPELVWLENRNLEMRITLTAGLRQERGGFHAKLDVLI